MKIALFETEPRESKAFEPMQDEHDLLLVEEPLRSSNADRHADVEIVSTFIYSKLDRNGLEMLPALKMVATRSTGFDHIDTEYCAERGVAIANVPSYGENTVAEHVFALLLAISHRMPEANLVAGHVLMRMRNVIVTPHSAFNTREAVNRIAEITVENIRAFAEGRPQNVVAGLTPAAEASP